MENTKVINLIDALKATCASYGLGNDGNEFKIITQIFLYKFLNDKFAYTAKKVNKRLQSLSQQAFYEQILAMGEDEYAELLDDVGANAKLAQNELLPSLYNALNTPHFAKTLDDTLIKIAQNNSDIFSIKTGGGAKVALFESLTNYITDPSRRDNFAKALISKLIDFDFAEFFEGKYDFFADIFEYLIKDYNKDNGGKYAEYYTPRSVGLIMAQILVKNQSYKSVSCYDPSAGSGTLLMSLAHIIGEDKCSIYAQDISQKSSQLLRLNLILNNLYHSIHNVFQGNTLTHPSHKQTFDFIVSNPPFKLDFSDFRAELVGEVSQNGRFFAGIPNILQKDKDKMAIYLCFIQHILYFLNDKGKAAIVVPTGFLTAGSKIELNIRQRLIETKSLRGIITMPPNIFATTGTNVSVIFIDKESEHSEVILIDASKMGEKKKIDKNERTILRDDETAQIIDTFNNKRAIEDFSIVVSPSQIAEKNYSFSAGQYFDFKIEHIDISESEFNDKIQASKAELSALFAKSAELQKVILANLDKLEFNE